MSFPAKAIALGHDPGIGSEFVPYHDGTEWRMARRDYGGTLADVGRIAPGDATDPRGCEVAVNAGRQIVFTQIVAGALTRFVSTNNGANWILI